MNDEDRFVKEDSIYDLIKLLELFNIMPSDEDEPDYVSGGHIDDFCKRLNIPTEWSEIANWGENTP